MFDQKPISSDREISISQTPRIPIYSSSTLPDVEFGQLVVFAEASTFELLIGDLDGWKILRTMETFIP